MALISCPECGKRVSDKAVSCPECGYPISAKEDNSTLTLEEIVEAAIKRYHQKSSEPISDIVKATGLTKLQAGYLVSYARDGVAISTLRDYNKLVEKARTVGRYNMTEEQEEAKEEENKQNFHNSLETISNAFGSKKPKKGVAYESKKLSVGRGLVGYGLAGPAGAVLGGLSSKKRQAVDPETGKKLSKREVKKRMK